MSTAANIVIGTLVLGGVYALVALGFVFIFRSTALFNFAHGQLLAIGAWMTLAMVENSVPALLAVAIACVSVGALGGLSYLVVVGRVEQHGLFVAVIATMGVAFMLDGLMPVIFGTRPEPLPILPDGAIRLGADVGVTWASFIVALIAILLYVLVVAADRRFLAGVRMRAAASDKLLAAEAGISVNRTFFIAWFSAGALAAAAGISYAATSIVSQDLVAIGLAGLPAALVGGFDSVKGTLPGALLVALAIVLVSTFWRADASLAVTYMLMLAFLLLKPEGLYGAKTVERV